MSFSFSNNAAKLRQLHADLHAAYQEEPHGERHRQACDTFHSQYEDLAFPGGMQNGLLALKNYDASAIKYSILFVENDPYFFRSGYCKQTMLTLLKNAPLSEPQRQRLMQTVYESINGDRRHHADYYSRLAGALANTEDVSRIQNMAQTANDLIKRRAYQALHVLRSRGKL